ncbi:FtsB family cell division protein [Kingella negevensis]|nr:septum formation initiator family protein [Kingella negevensis]MDK4680275.1 septum formation initiator family protein [Kingella negevensis]MDK4682005.1 septum formation initiator family protein [Kingella negevensis]MDK4684689.1 septum formation initiator family protein [Kingella negevensis]MDK4688639.1 septum formation initiator family protein [Kingella negevensis]MDK4690201.1 septum formation initiator family protein [Kingella negevensis]
MRWITWAMIVTLCALQYQIWVSNGGTGLRGQYAEMEQKAEGIKQQNKNTRRENAILRSEINDLQNGYNAVSELARNNMGYIEEGEVFYTLKPQ